MSIHQYVYSGEERIFRLSLDGKRDYTSVDVVIKTDSAVSGNIEGPKCTEGSFTEIPVETPLDVPCDSTELECVNANTCGTFA